MPSAEQLEQLVQALTDHVMGTLGKPAPTPPQAPQSQPLTPMAGLAAVRNPQFAPYLMQQAQAPEQARFATQQSAFEAAMQGRHEALGLGGQLAGAGMRSASMRPIVRENTIIGEDNKRYRVREILDPQTGAVTSQNVIGEAPESTAFLPTTQGYVPASRQSGQITSGPMQIPGRGTAYPAPPAGVVQDVAAGTATLGGLDALWTAYQDIRSATAGESRLTDIARQRIGMAVGETRLGGALAPEYANYVAVRRAALNAYIKSQTGAQFSVRELERYEAQYPEPTDPEDVARNKLEALRQRALADMQAKLRVYPAAGAAAPAAAPAEDPAVTRAKQLIEERRRQRANP